MTIGAWRTGYCVVNGFRQFYRDWQPPKEHYPTVLALHGSLTQRERKITVHEANMGARPAHAERRD